MESFATVARVVETKRGRQMREQAETVVVEYPLGWRIVATLLCAGMAAGCFAFLAPWLDEAISARVVFGLFGVWLAVCTFRAATGPHVFFHADRAVFRKIARTQTFERAEIAEFERGAWSFNGTQKLAVRLADGSVKSVPLDGPMGRGTRFDRILEEGNAWLG